MCLENNVSSGITSTAKNLIKTFKNKGNGQPSHRQWMAYFGQNMIVDNQKMVEKQVTLD